MINRAGDGKQDGGYSEQHGRFAFADHDLFLHAREVNDSAPLGARRAGDLADCSPHRV
jgi:hypothetical protein